jgi:hypothetical protein
MRPRGAPSEPLVLDGFRSFEHSQYWPMDLNLLIGASHFVYGFNDAELRRSGTMRPSQRQRRSELEREYGRPDPRATERSVRELLRRTLPEGASVKLHSDEHQAYRRAIRGVERCTIEHVTTSSNAPRTIQNPLFPVNLADLLLRHSGSNHKRETIAFSKRRQSALYRLAIWVVWRNYLKSVSENRPGTTPAMILGLVEEPLSAQRVLRRRRFPDGQNLTGWLRACYEGRIPTRAMTNCAIHSARYAF